MLRIRRFGVVQTATTVAVISAAFVFVAIVILALFVLVLGSSVDLPGTGGFGFAAQGFVGLLIGGVLAALIYAVVGFIAAAIGCAIYNVVAGWTGGIELQIDQAAPPPPAPEWGSQPPPPPPPPAAPPPPPAQPVP